jgi:hypothetical protein
VRVSTDVNDAAQAYCCDVDSDGYAIVAMPGGGPPRVWPTGGRSKEGFEAHCATCGASVVRAYASLEEAIEAICLPMLKFYQSVGR